MGEFIFMTEKIPEHKILDTAKYSNKLQQTMRYHLSSYQVWTLIFNYDQFPNDFIYSYSITICLNSPLLEMSVTQTRWN